MEFIFYLIFFTNYFIRRKINSVKNVVTLYSLEIVILSLIFVLSIIFVNERGDNCYYLGGVCFFLGRYILINTSKGKKVIEFAYSPQRKYVYSKYALLSIFVYIWLVVSRLCPPAGLVFMLVPIVFDLLPPNLPKGCDFFIKEFNRLQMPIYILHSTFMIEPIPRGFPMIRPADSTFINPCYASWFIAWQLPFLYMMLSYPAWFINRPLELLPILIKDRKKYTKQDWMWFGVGGCLNVVLIILTQTYTFGAA